MVDHALQFVIEILFGTFSERMATERDRLCALDGVIGDAGHVAVVTTWHWMAASQSRG
ncbi:hypothetical protein P9228_05500 [Mesorhizobium sp. WSM4898]|uniref:hypothetical protein n=1 Tax=Mesorhizobium sp. WSM4898 TaxID=3038544 RepID=UPI002415827C|nr:hypothetical protein [Mesorhizobium sp. WSM4898]MDG4905903.1 hypothetical protein [Mesorhizobium sp. WSM4898]